MPFQIQKTPLMDRKLELAAALFSVLGAEIPHQTELEQEAADLFSSLGSRSKTLKKFWSCANPRTARRHFIFPLKRAPGWGVGIADRMWNLPHGICKGRRGRLCLPAWQSRTV